MGREIRRVPLDFDWPLHKVWRGFINPHYKPCPLADSGNCVAGYSAAGKWFGAVVRLLAMLGDEAVESSPMHRERHARTRRTYPHPYLQEWAHAPRTDLPHDVRSTIHEMESGPEKHRAAEAAHRQYPSKILPLTGELADFVRGLAGEQGSGIFGNHFDESKIEQALRCAAGLAERWGVCPVCDGHGIDPSIREANEAWKPEPPPSGDGWQLWETVTEGSPVSPVLPTREAFVDWLVLNGYTRKAAEAFTKDGWCPNAIGVDGKIYEGIESAVIGGKPS